MYERRSPSRGERARVARRVRALLDTHVAPPAQQPAAGEGLDPLVREMWPLAGDRVDIATAAPPSAPHRHRPGDGGSAARLPSRLSDWLQRRGVQFNPGRRGAAAMGAAVLIAAILVGWWVFAARPHSVAISPSAPDGRSVSAVPMAPPPPGSTSPPAGPGSSSPQVVVDVVGKVRHPGVYRLPLGSRVGDVLRAAGGALHGVDLTSLNLARKVADGEQIAVGVPAASAGGTTPTGSSSPGGQPAGPVDLNTAGAEQLDALPGVGPVLAQRIVDWRTAHGRFDSIDQLREVSGIGPSKFDDIRALVIV